jgi:hypothetical protein
LPLGKIASLFKQRFTIRPRFCIKMKVFEASGLILKQKKEKKWLQSLISGFKLPYRKPQNHFLQNMNCKNCDTELNSNFCPKCGQPKVLKRIDSHYIIHEIQHVLHLERGFLYTIKELVVNPGENVKKYLSENRTRLVKPIIFIILTSLIYSLSSYFFHFQDGYLAYLESDTSSTGKIFKWAQDHLGYSNIIMGVFVAFWTKLFFRKYHYNIFEILILFCFAFGISMLIYSLFGTLKWLTKINFKHLADIICFVYTTWAIGHFYDKTKVSSYLKAFFAYISGMLTYGAAVVLLGNLFDLLRGGR